MNIDEEKDPYSYGDSTEIPKPTMSFYWEPIFKNLSYFISMAPKMSRNEYVKNMVIVELHTDSELL